MNTTDSVSTKITINTTQVKFSNPYIQNQTQLDNSSTLFNSMNKMSLQEKAWSVENIQTWLVSKLSEELELNDEIDIQEPFAYYGLSSMTAVGLSGDLENLLGIKLPVTVAWDYPTVESLAEYLKNELS
ncbi:acyl carrier protein [Nostoc sp.]|uniref:acyl carrier protein n=1 Tax=Nostoc sp. TaxID=1180 RepID=UPI002FFC52F2